MKLILNFMTSQRGEQTIVIHILPNISRSKGNQTEIWSVVIWQNLTREILCMIFLENHTQNVVKKLVPDPFLKN